jgi:N5-hydroxyornithine acetyltransferase
VGNFVLVFSTGIDATKNIKEIVNAPKKDAPPPHLFTSASWQTSEKGKPKGEWRINVKREGIFKGRHLLPKLERMGIISTEDSSVGPDTSERTGESWNTIFASQRSFWQIDPRIFLFTLSPAANSPFPGGSTPYDSRPSSPIRADAGNRLSRPDLSGEITQGLWSPQPPGPFASTSHLPTYYPPPPPQYIFTNAVRHPIRPKPPAQGETFYTRYISSFDQYLSFRIASVSPNPSCHLGPISATSKNFLPPNSSVNLPISTSSLGTMNLYPRDPDLLHSWMNEPRVSAFWGLEGPPEIQESFLAKGLSDRHSFPVIGCWDGKPFGYFEIYWVKEDPLGRYLASKDVNDWDRGFHALIGEQEFRGQHRVKVWLSALVHYCWLADPRTEKVLVEPRIDNEK